MKNIYKVLITALLVSSISSADGIVIANSSVASAGLSKSEVSKIFLGKQTVWSDGSGIVTGYQVDTASASTFFNGYVGKKFKKFKKYWLKKVFSGNGVAPKTFSSSAQAVTFVKATHGAIVFIDAASAPAGVTAVSIDGAATFK